MLMHRDGVGQTMGGFFSMFYFRHFLINFYDVFLYYELVIKMEQCN